MKLSRTPDHPALWSFALALLTATLAGGCSALGGDEQVADAPQADVYTVASSSSPYIVPTCAGGASQVRHNVGWPWHEAGLCPAVDELSVADAVWECGGRPLKYFDYSCGNLGDGKHTWTSYFSCCAPDPCVTGTYGGSEYLICSGSLTQPEAASYCASRDGFSLAHVDTEAESRWIVDTGRAAHGCQEPPGDGLLSVPTSYWIANLTSATPAAWPGTGDPVYAPGEPSGDGPNINLQRFCDPSAQYLWNDEPGTAYRHGWVCKSPICPPPDACHEAGTFSLAKGACVYPVKAAGAPCDDGDACTQIDACNGAGRCVGTNPEGSCPSGCERDLLVIVDPAIAPALAPSLAQYQADLHDEGTEAYAVTWAGGGAADLKALIHRHYVRHAIKGAWLVGSLPAAWFEGGGQQFPTDLYLMQQHGSWSDSDGNGRLDVYPPLAPELFTARLQGTAAQISAYFDKIHRFRTTGALVAPSAYGFVGQDWTAAAPQIQAVAGTLYQQVDLDVGNAEATRDAYLGRLGGVGAEYVIQWSHADASCMYFETTTVCTADIAQHNLKGSFYWMWECDASRFTEPSPTQAQTYLTSTDYGLATIGTTMTGGTPFQSFHAGLAAGLPWGEAYRGTFGPTSDLGSLGLVIMGDPMLLPTRTTRAALSALATTASPAQEEGLRRSSLRDVGARRSGTHEEYRARFPEFFVE